MLDTPTLLVALVLDDLVLAAALWLALGGRARRDVRGWCASLALQALALALIALRASSRSAATASDADGDGAMRAAFAVTIAGSSALVLTLQLGALATFQRRPLARAWHLLPALACALFGGALAAHPALRAATLALLLGALLIAIALSARRGEPGHGPRVVTWAAFAGAVALVARAVVVVRADIVARGVVAARSPAAEALAGAIVPSLTTLFAHAATVAMSLGFVVMQRERHARELDRLAMTDPLTGIYNRRMLYELGDKEVARARRTGASLSAIIADLDHFKRINDKHGHLGGDAVLVRFVEVVRGCLRQSDLVGRYGGEELCILLPDVGLAGAKVVGERIRAAIESATFSVDDAPLPVTASVGVAALPSGGQATLSSLVQRADQALYVAKRDGRNRVSVAKAA